MIQYPDQRLMTYLEKQLDKKEVQKDGIAGDVRNVLLLEASS